MTQLLMLVIPWHIVYYPQTLDRVLRSQVESQDQRHAMASRLVPLAILVSAAILGSPSHSYPQSPQPSPAAENTLLPGILIDSSNVTRYAQILPAAAQAAIRYGLKVRVVPTQRLDWSTGFTKATEKYSVQVGLDQRTTSLTTLREHHFRR